MKERPMTPVEKARVFSMRCRAKKGELMERGDVEYFDKMRKMDPEGYAAMDDSIFNETAKSVNPMM